MQAMCGSACVHLKLTENKRITFSGDGRYRDVIEITGSFYRQMLY
jgi:hypothetical protein